MSEAGANIAALESRFVTGEVGAVGELRAYLEGGSWQTIESAAVLRYLLRSVCRLGLVRAPRTVLAATLRLLKPVWAAPIDLKRICDTLELGEYPDASSGPEAPKDPAGKLVLRTLADLQSTERLCHLLPRTAHRVAKLVTPESRPVIYKRILDACCSALEPPPTPRQSIELLARLQSLGMVKMANTTDEQTFLSNVTRMLTNPVHLQPQALGALLESSDEVIELYASDEDLARVLADW